MSRKLLKSTGVVGGITLLSRITGLVRDVVFAYVMGSGLVADAFFVAFRIPNFFRRIFGEGAFSQAFVPVFAEYREKHSESEARAFTNHMAGRLGLILLLLTVVGIVAAPAVVVMIAPGFIDNPEQFALTVDALRITFPYLLFISLVAMSAGILNTCGYFAAPAATPVLLNFALIAAAFWIVPGLGNAAIGLSLGVLIAGVMQLVFQVPFLKRAGYLPFPQLRPRNEGVSRVFRLMLPAIFSVSVAQINMVVNTLLASFLVTGSISWLYYSDRLMEFPLGVFGIALATVILPSLSRLHARGEPQVFSQLMDWSLRWVFLIGVPASVGLIALAGPMMTTLFQYGATTPDDVRMMSKSLIAFAVGLLGFVLVKVLAPGFFARQDTKTPMRVAVVAVTANIVLSLLLIIPLAHVGLALAISLVAWINAGLLFRLLRKQEIYTPRSGWLAYFARVTAAGMVMGGVLWWGAGDLDSWIHTDLADRVIQLGGWVVAGALVYFSVIFTLGIRPRQLMLSRTEIE
jgi:putative peptidoglycan lipid II flippase